MKTPRLFTALTGLTIAGTLALSGCADYNIEEPDTAPQSSDEASAFLGCLTSAGVDAKINTSGQVLIKTPARSEEHTSELQSRFDLVCRLLLEKKKKQRHYK